MIAAQTITKLRTVGRPLSDNRILAQELGVTRKRIFRAGGADKLRKLDRATRNLLLGCVKVDECPDCGSKMNIVMSRGKPAIPVRYVCRCGKMEMA